MPKKICAAPGCHTLVSKGTRCSVHVSRHSEYSKHSRNKKSEHFYNSTPWRKKRKEVMESYNGLCQECLSHGTIKSADVVDHIEELVVSPHLALDNDNLLPLCHACHNAKGHV